jgi:His/Glu/Gln/Arg/opine family amino acid ABC transporter permease subunit
MSLQRRPFIALALADGLAGLLQSSAALATAYVELIRNTPFIVQLFFIFFGLPSLGLRLSSETASIIAMTLNLGAYAAEIVRAGIDNTPRGQLEAARSLAMTERQAVRPDRRAGAELLHEPHHEPQLPLVRGQLRGGCDVSRNGGDAAATARLGRTALDLRPRRADGALTWSNSRSGKSSGICCSPPAGRWRCR